MRSTVDRQSESATRAVSGSFAAPAHADAGADAGASATVSGTASAGSEIGAAPPGAGEELSRAILSSLPAHIAVLNGAGVIVAVNEAWVQFARDNGGNEQTGGVGTNYLGVCAASAG